VHLAQPSAVAAAYAATVRSLVAIITAFNAQMTAMEDQVSTCFGQARDAEIYLSQPGLGQVLAARAPGEFSDDEHRYLTARNRKNYASTSPITRAPGKKKIVLARFIHNDRPSDALHQQAFCALSASPGARGYYDQLRARGMGHHAALRQLANRLVGILHGCLKTRTTYDEHTAWHTTTKINTVPLDN
jgi:Transposase IS116/IS110/IS902 family